MPATITKSVGRGGANIASDVTAVQTLLGARAKQLGLPPLGVNGVADAATITAIIAFQQQILWAKTPDGRVDPGGDTLRALNAPPAPAKVVYSEKVPAAARLASQYAFKVIEKAVVAAGIRTAVITSTLRLPAEQAAIMYAKASTDLAGQHALYGPAGDKVLDVFEANRSKPKDQVIALMIAKIDALAAQGIRVSQHVVPLDIYAKLNVIDVGVGSTQPVAGPAFNVAKITAAFARLNADGYIKKFIDETSLPNNCWHLEIVPGARPL